MNSVKLKAWTSAARLRTLPLALSSISMGGFLAAYFQQFNFIVFISCLLTTLFLQVLSNFANDYGDTIHGADSKDREGPSRAVQSGLISKAEMKQGIILFSILSLISGLLLLYSAFQSINIPFLIFFLLGLAAIAAAIKYTAGKNPYGYSGFGDLFVFIFFGVVAVGGTFFLQTGKLIPHIMLPAVSVGLFAVGVLNINNIRDIESDKKAGKYSIPVRIGEKKAKLYHLFLLSGGFVCAALFVFINYQSFWQLIFLLSLPLFVQNGHKVIRKTKRELDPYLKHMALTTMVFVLLFGLGLILSL